MLNVKDRMICIAKALKDVENDYPKKNENNTYDLNEMTTWLNSFGKSYLKHKEEKMEELFDSDRKVVWDLGVGGLRYADE